MKYDLRKPCNNCPFRNDIPPYLHPDRINEIVGVEFACHKTTKHDDDGERMIRVEHEKEQHCAGSLIMHEKMEIPHQMMRICERLGIYDRTKLDMDAPVYDDISEMIDTHEETHFAPR